VLDRLWFGALCTTTAIAAWISHPLTGLAGAGLILLMMGESLLILIKDDGGWWDRGGGEDEEPPDGPSGEPVDWDAFDRERDAWSCAPVTKEARGRVLVGAQAARSL
jgi:hypothetical protein